MEALEIVNTILTKEVIASVAEPLRGPPGHGLLVILRLLLYALFEEMFSARFLLKHLKKRASVGHAWASDDAQAREALIAGGRSTPLLSFGSLKYLARTIERSYDQNGRFWTVRPFLMNMILKGERDTPAEESSSDSSYTPAVMNIKFHCVLSLRQVMCMIARKQRSCLLQLVELEETLHMM